MRFSGKTIVDRGPEALWGLLLDPASLRHCIPGCRELELIRDGEYHVRLKAGVGPIKGTFRGRVRLRDIEPARRYRLLVEARGITGSFTGETAVELESLDGGERTQLSYDGEAEIRGAVASVGARLLHGAARSHFEEFIRKLSSL